MYHLHCKPKVSVEVAKTGKRHPKRHQHGHDQAVTNTPTDALIHLIRLSTPSLITRSVAYTSWTLVSVYLDSLYLSLLSPTPEPAPTYYREYNPDSAGTRRDECLVGDSHRQILVDGDKGIEVVQE